MNLLSLVPGKLKQFYREEILKVDEDIKGFYSQFGEDAALQGYFGGKAWNKYGNVNRMDKGFYIDVGAYHPTRLSNTYWFYKKGWKGINIDASEGMKPIFDAQRPRDINVQAVVSDEEENVTFYSWGAGSVYNTLDPSLIPEITRKAGYPPREFIASSRPLGSILDRFLPENMPLSFISVDVEGHDLAVLKSNDWTKYRPELVVVENHESTIEKIISSDISTFMNSQEYHLLYWIPPTVIYERNDLSGK